jgi:hypothetical protein
MSALGHKRTSAHVGVIPESGYGFRSFLAWPRRFMSTRPSASVPKDGKQRIVSGTAREKSRRTIRDFFPKPKAIWDQKLHVNGLNKRSMFAVR